MAAYDRHEFHVVYQKISQFAAVELSAIYHDAVKDRLYTDADRLAAPALHANGAASHDRNRLCGMLSPILVFTADEAWEFIPGREVESVHLARWQAGGLELPVEEESRWKQLLMLREEILSMFGKGTASQNDWQSLGCQGQNH